MLTLNFNPFPILSTERLTLRQITKEDAEEIFFLRSDKQVLEFLDRAPATSIDEAFQWIQMINEAIANNEYIAWAIAQKNETKLIGTITFWNLKKEHHRLKSVMHYIRNTRVKVLCRKPYSPFWITVLKS